MNIGPSATSQSRSHWDMQYFSLYFASLALPKAFKGRLAHGWRHLTNARDRDEKRSRRYSGNLLVRHVEGNRALRIGGES
jgi:hypothetical protein